MRNLGLALLLIASVTAPHAAWGKKHPPGKRSRNLMRSQKHLKHSHQTTESLAPARSDTLARAVAEHKRDEQATTAAAPPAEPREPPGAAAPRTVESAPNAPMDPANQSNDDEVPGSRKKR